MNEEKEGEDGQPSNAIKLDNHTFDSITLRAITKDGDMGGMGTDLIRPFTSDP